MGNPRSNDGILDAPKYKYEPILADSTSRILILKNGYYEDELAGDLEMAKLDECPPWKALSYAWGTTTTYARIKIGTGYVRISANLEAALRRLRQAYGDEAPGARVRLWIDQICIDQENIQERSQQVQLMYDIYKQAEKVLVWLGPDDICVAGKAFAAIRLIASLDEDQARTIRDEGLGASVPPLELEPVKALFDCRWVCICPVPTKSEIVICQSRIILTNAKTSVLTLMGRSRSRDGYASRGPLGTGTHRICSPLRRVPNHPHVYLGSGK